MIDLRIKDSCFTTFVDQCSDGTFCGSFSSPLKKTSSFDDLENMKGSSSPTSSTHIPLPLPLPPNSILAKKKKKVCFLEREVGYGRRPNNNSAQFMRNHTFPVLGDDKFGDTQKLQDTLTDTGANSDYDDFIKISVVKEDRPMVSINNFGGGGLLMGDNYGECDKTEDYYRHHQSSYSYTPTKLMLPRKSMTLIAKRVLPPNLLFSKWKRLYSLVRDGDSFERMLDLVHGHSQTLLIIRASGGSLKNEVFGGFTSSPWEKQRHHHHGSHSVNSSSCCQSSVASDSTIGTSYTSNSTGGFFGSGLSSLFQLVPSSKVTGVGSNSGGTQQQQYHHSDINVFKWTGKNDMVQVVDHDNHLIAMGGGGKEGGFGLCIEDDFTRGSTNECDTFKNKRLTLDQREFFDILDVEIWGFLPWDFS